MKVQHSNRLWETTYAKGQFEVDANAWEVSAGQWQGFATIYQVTEDDFREVAEADNNCTDDTPSKAIRRALCEVRHALDSAWFVYDFQRKDCEQCVREALELVKTEMPPF